MKCLTKKCNANALTNDKHCFFHSDKISDKEKKQARIKGGKARQIRVKSEFDIYKLRNINDVLILNEKLINDVLQNKIDLRIITGIAYNLNLQMKLIELHSIESKINSMEKIVIKLPESFNNYNYELQNKAQES